MSWTADMYWLLARERIAERQEEAQRDRLAAQAAARGAAGEITTAGLLGRIFVRRPAVSFVPPVRSE